MLCAVLLALPLRTRRFTTELQLTATDSETVIVSDVSKSEMLQPKVLAAQALQSPPGQGAAYLPWLKVWRRWCVSLHDEQSPRRPSHPDSEEGAAQSWWRPSGCPALAEQEGVLGAAPGECASGSATCRVSP